MQHHHPQSTFAIERVELSFDELSAELDIQSRHDSGWITIMYRGETIANYLPVHEIAELDLHILVDESVNSMSEPVEVTERLIEALTTLRDRGFKICREYTEDFGNGRFQQSLVLRNRSVTEEDILELIPIILDASRYAIDLAAKQDSVQIGSD